MIIDIIVLVFLALVVFLMIYEGPFSSIILLFCSLMASIVTMGYYEVAAHIFSHWRPNFARGVGFLLLFFVCLAAMRTLFDFLVRGDIELPPLPAKITSGVVGFFIGMIVIGTTLIGVQMLPVTASIAGFNRYPHGFARSSSGVWFDPDGFVESIWDLMSGNSMGGSPRFSIVHPHLLRELYGLRYTVQFAGKKALPPSLFKVEAAGVIPNSKAPLLAIPPQPNKKLLIVRTVVQHGSRAPLISSDDGYLRLTPSEVRLVTDEGRQYYPIGYLKYGSVFQKLTFNTAIVDDYRHVGGHRVVIQNWVFAIGANQKPYLIEMKGTARGRVSGLGVPKTLISLPPHDYPKLAYENSKLTITLNTSGKFSNLVGVAIPARIRMLKISGMLETAYRRLGVISRAINNSQPPWSAAAEKTQGTPSAGQAGQWRNTANRMIPHSNSYREPWYEVLPVLVTGQIGTDTSRSLARVRHYFQSQIIPLLDNQEPVNLHVTAGMAQTIRIAPGSWQIIVWSIGSSKMRVWSATAHVRIGQANSVDLNDSDLVVKYNLGG